MAAWACNGQAQTSPPAQSATELNLLGCLQLGGGVPSRARDYFEEAAAELPAARFNLGLMLVRGQGGDAQESRGRAAIESVWRETSLPEAGAWLLESALARRELKTARAIAERLQGTEHPRSDLVVARLRFMEGRHEQALTLTRRAAAAGQAQAARLLAMLERSNTGLPRDAMESASWQMIAEAMLSPVRPTDSVFHAAVKHSIQANDWTGQGAVAIDTLMACGPLRPASARGDAASASAGAMRTAASAIAGAEPAVASAVAAVAGALPAEPAPVQGTAVRSATASDSSTTPATPAPHAAVASAQVPPEASAGQAAPIRSASADGDVPPLLPAFTLKAGLGVRDSWLAYGQQVGVPLQWAGPDVAARADSTTQPRSLESLGLLIVHSARAVGVRLKLQVQQDDAGVARSLRIVPTR